MNKLKVVYADKVDPDAEGDLIESCPKYEFSDSKVKIKKKDGGMIVGTKVYDKNGKELNSYSKDDNDLMGW